MCSSDLWLVRRAAPLSTELAVGTIHELPSIPGDHTPVVLTPTLDATDSVRPDAILTIGGDQHLARLGATSRRVLVKIRSSMNRYGIDPADAPSLIARTEEAGHTVVGVSIHPPTVGTSADHAREITALLAPIDERHAAWVSHVDVDDYDSLRAASPDREWRLRLGTALWHGDKSHMKLVADVLDARQVRAGDTVGYRGTRIDGDGTLLMIGCGSAHGIAPLDNGLCPFHFGRRRLELVESPHMHTTLVVAPAGQPTPAVGDFVDVQRPLIGTRPDIVEWR